MYASTTTLYHALCCSRTAVVHTPDIPWCLICADAAARASRIGLAFAPTRITLPLKSTIMQSDGGLSLRQRFGDVHPTLLLFLQKLQMLAITDTVDAQRSTVMVRRQLEHGLVELRHGPAAEHVARWLVVE